LQDAHGPRLTRRRLIQGFAAAGTATWLSGGAALAHPRRDRDFAHFTAIAPSTADALQVPDGYEVDLLVSWGDELGDGLRFGYNCDYTAFFPLDRDEDEGILWVNHEYVIPWYTSDWRSSMDPTWDPRVEPYRSIMRREKEDVGGSLVHVKRRRRGHHHRRGPWEVVFDSRFNRRFTAAAPPVPYDGPAASILPEGALGTLANCSGGLTPWGTLLSAEENYQSYGLKRAMPFALGWDRDGDPNYYVGEPGLNAYGATAVEKPNYGYMVEVDPFTGRAVKHTALGRIHHENAAMRVAHDGRIVAYTGDDAPAADGMLFKFVSKRRYRRGMSRRDAMKLLGEGQLYVAQFLPTSNDPAIDSGTGRWHPLDMSPESCAFTTQWVRDNIVAQVGGTLSQFQVPRAEDCELVPGRPTDVLVSLTSAAGLPADRTAYGVVRLVREDSKHSDETSFTWQNVLEGGQHTGFASPDNMTFSGRNELWLATDISTSSLNVPGRGFEWHGNNALYYVPLRGPNANVAFRFANAPVRAELTGPTYVRGSNTMFLSVQHPGEPGPASELDDPITPANYKSHWPEGGLSKPKPSVVAIRKP
jgi:secreted PhoX family phosphatase